MNNKPAYYGILPACVRYDTSIPPMARIMYAEVSALSNKDGFCSAGNRYFADLYNVTTVTVSRWFSQMEKAGHFYIESDPTTGHNRKVYPLNKNVKAPIQKNQGPLNKNVKHNNTSIILQENKGESNDSTPADLFEKIEGLKKKIGPKHYQYLNEACQKDEDTYQLLRGMFHDGRFKQLMNWLEYKKESRRGYKAKQSIKKLITDFSEYTPQEVSKAVSSSVSNGYSGVFLKKLSDKQVSADRQKQSNTPTPIVNLYEKARKQTSVV